MVHSIARTRPTRLIGTEIEGVGADSSVVRRIANAHGWAQVADGSLDDDRPAHHYPTDAFLRTFEAVSPPLKPKERGEAPRMLARLRDAGMRVNSTCGLHVHVDAEGLSVDALLHLLSHWYQHQAIIYAILGQRTQRLRAYVCPFPDEMMARIAAARPADRQALLEAWRKACKQLKYLLDSDCTDVPKKELERYWGLNFAALRKHGTVEFRAFEATTVPRRLRAYIALADALVERAVQAGPFTDWSLLEEPPARAAATATHFFAGLSVDEWAKEHFLTMLEQTRWARKQKRDVSASFADLLRASLPGQDSPLDAGAMEAAHRTAEACLTGARHLDLAGLSLFSLPPGVLQSRQLRTVDLRQNFINHRPMAPLHLRLDFTPNPALRGAAQRLQDWAETDSRHRRPWDTALQVYTCVAKQQDALTLSSRKTPPLLDQLQHVRHLTLERSRNFPEWVLGLPGLQKLSLPGGSLYSLPSWLGDMPELAWVDLTGSRGRVRIPPSLVAAPNFWRISGPKVVFADDAEAAQFADDGRFGNCLTRPANWSPSKLEDVINEYLDEE